MVGNLKFSKINVPIPNIVLYSVRKSESIIKSCTFEPFLLTVLMKKKRGGHDW